MEPCNAISTKTLRRIGVWSPSAAYLVSIAWYDLGFRSFGLPFMLPVAVKDFWFCFFAALSAGAPSSTWMLAWDVDRQGDILMAKGEPRGGRGDVPEGPSSCRHDFCTWLPAPGRDVVRVVCLPWQSGAGGRQAKLPCEESSEHPPRLQRRFPGPCFIGLSNSAICCIYLRDFNRIQG